MLHCACNHFFVASLRGSLQCLVLCDEVAGLFIGRLAAVFDERPLDRGFLVQFCVEIMNLRDTSKAVEDFLSSIPELWTPDFVEKISSLWALQKGSLFGATPPMVRRAVASSGTLPVAAKKAEQNSPVLTRVEMTVSKDDDPFADIGDGPEDPFSFNHRQDEGTPKEEKEIVGDGATSNEETVFDDFVTNEPDEGTKEKERKDVALGEVSQHKEAKEEEEEEESTPKSDVAFGEFSAPENVAFGDFGAPQFSEFREHNEEDGSKENVSKEDVESAAVVETPEEVSFGDFNAAENISFGDFNDDVSKEEVSFGAFAAPEEVSFGDFNAPENVAFGEFVTPSHDDAKKTAVPESVSSSSSWAAFEDAPAAKENVPNGVEEGTFARALFARAFPRFPSKIEGAVQSLSDLASDWSSLDQKLIANGVTNNVSQLLLMNTLRLKEPPVVAAPVPAVAVVHQPTPPPMRLTPATQEQAVLVIAQPTVMRDFSSDDFGFLSSFSNGAKKSSNNPSPPPSSTSPGFELFFSQQPAAMVSLEQARQAIVSELAGSLSDLSFMLPDTLCLPQQRPASLLDFF
jgi:hypothetical protein